MTGEQLQAYVAVGVVQGITFVVALVLAARGLGWVLRCALRAVIRFAERRRAAR